MINSCLLLVTLVVFSLQCDCPDNGNFCDGNEFCDSNNICRNTGNPCTRGLQVGYLFVVISAVQQFLEEMLLYNGFFMRVSRFCLFFKHPVMETGVTVLRLATREPVIANLLKQDLVVPDRWISSNENNFKCNSDTKTCSCSAVNCK